MGIKIDGNKLYDSPDALPTSAGNNWLLEGTGKILSQSGRLYKVFRLTVRHCEDHHWRISLLWKALALTLFSFGFGLASKSVKRLWSAIWTGKLHWKERFRAKVKVDLSSQETIQKIFNDLTDFCRQDLSSANGKGWYYGDGIKRGYAEINGGYFYGNGMVYDFFSKDYNENVVRINFANVGNSFLSINSQSFSFDLLQSGKLFVRQGLLREPKDRQSSLATEKEWRDFEKVLSNIY